LIRGRGNWLCKRGFASLRLSFSISSLKKGSLIRGSIGFEGAKPLQNLYFPLMLRIHLPIMERGIKGVR
jgi:hypothetical protein